MYRPARLAAPTHARPACAAGTARAADAMHDERSDTPPVAVAAPSRAGLVPGVLLAGAIALGATALAALPVAAQSGLSALTLAIVAGMLATNVGAVPARWALACEPGLGFAKQRLLRAGIVLYGFRLTLAQVAGLGWVGVAADALMLVTTFGLAAWLGPRAFGLERPAALLVGAGSAICGAAAVLATEPVVRARSEQVALAVATVVLFGTLAMFGYPVLYTLGSHLAGAPLDEVAFGLYIGSTVHEVAQVVAAGQAVGPHAADAAVVGKMIRVMMLAPFLVALSWWMARAVSATPSPSAGAVETAAADGPPARGPSASGRARIVVPWFALGFLACVALNSVAVLPPAWSAALVQIDNVLLATAMAALGLQTHRRVLRAAGWRALALAGMLAVWLAAGGALVNAALFALC